MTQFLAAVQGGLALGVPLFLVASGLTLIYGVMGVLNFAHGALFAVGAYVLVSVVGGTGTSLTVFVLAAILGALAVGLVGLLSERLVFARLYSQGHVINLLASFAILLALNGLIVLIWGTRIHTARPPEALSGAWELGGVLTPVYNVMLIVVGLVIAVGLWVLIERTPMGIRIRAVAHDRQTARALGVRVTWVGAGVFALGSALAGLGGALNAPLLSVAPGLDTVFIIQSFVVVIVGGLGSVWGALVAAIGLGLVNSFLISYAPEWSAYGMYVAVAIVLLLRPQGIFGRSTLQEA